MHTVWSYLERHSSTSVKQIDRLTLSLAGQPVAVLVSGDVTERNGTYYFMNAHPSAALGTGLGSTRALLNSNNGIVDNAITHYHPLRQAQCRLFGSYRGDTPAQQLTDQGFTGHKHNDDLGLIYMNARYYVGSIGRFASADTIVPDPMMWRAEINKGK